MKLLTILLFTFLSFNSYAVNLVCSGISKDVSEANYFAGSNSSYSGTHYLSFSDDFKKLEGYEVANSINSDPNKRYDKSYEFQNVKVVGTTVLLEGKRKGFGSEDDIFVKAKVERSTGQLLYVYASEGELNYTLTFNGSCSKASETKF